MKTTKQIALHLRQVYFGGNWTTVNLKDSLSTVSREQALRKIMDFNTIAMLAYHINYYVSAVLKVLEGEALNAKDAYSFDHPPIETEEEWQAMLEKIWDEGKRFSEKIEELPDETLWEYLEDQKYGTYFRNLFGIIEHSHYHLGQISLLKKML